MLYLCLSLMVLLCVSAHTLKPHNIHSLYILYWVCYACQNHPCFWWMLCLYYEKIHLLCACQILLVTQTTFCWLCSVLNEVVVWYNRRRVVPLFRGLCLFLRLASRCCDTASASSSNTQSSSTGTKITHSPVLLKCTYPERGPALKFG